MEIVSIDELNNLGYETRSIPYEKYFGEMELTDEQKKQRIAFSRDIESEIMFVVSLLLAMLNNLQLDIEYAVSELHDRYTDVFLKYGNYTPEIDRYIWEISREIVETTILNVDDEYYRSMDRIIFASENEANTSLNYSDFQKAVAEGKTKKTWVDMKDNRERKSHIAVGSKTIPINDFFIVGKSNSKLLFPKDTSNGASASEIINCRCSVKYS